MFAVDGKYNCAGRKLSLFADARTDGFCKIDNDLLRLFNAPGAEDRDAQLDARASKSAETAALSGRVL